MEAGNMSFVACREMTVIRTSSVLNLLKKP